MNLKRVLTTVLGIPVVVSVFLFANVYIIDIILAIIAIRSIAEYCKCAESTSKTIVWLAFIPAIMLAFIHIIPADIWKIILPISLPIFLLLGFLQVIITNGKTSFKEFSYTIAGVAYIIPLIAFVSLLYGSEKGKIYFWYMLFASWGSDIFAYIVGKNFGKHKFSKISPNKTIEGCIAGLSGAVVFCLLYTIFINQTYNMNINYLYILVVSIILGILGQIGDFSASVIKRYFEVKDFSELFPGHGGMIDRIDSIIFIAPFAYYSFIILLG